MKTVKEKSGLNSLQETISLIYDIDPKDIKRISKKELEWIVTYYLGDIQYVIYKRNVKDELQREDIEDDELLQLLKENKIPESIHFDTLSQEELARLSMDADYLNKYNSLYGSERILQMISSFYAGLPQPIVEDADLIDNIKKRQLLINLGLKKYLKVANKTIDEKVHEQRMNQQRKEATYKEIINTTSIRSRIK